MIKSNKKENIYSRSVTKCKLIHMHQSHTRYMPMHHPDLHPNFWHSYIWGAILCGGAQLSKMNVTPEPPDDDLGSSGES